MRIAGLLHLADGTPGDEIDRCTVERAIYIGQYLIVHAQAAFAVDECSTSGASLVLNWIRRRGVADFSKRDVFEGLKGRFKRAEDLDTPLEQLVRNGYLRPATTPRSGAGRPPSQRFEVNPSLAKNNSHNSQNGPEGQERPGSS